MNVLKPSQNQKLSGEKISVFLGGTIDMGDSVDWQECVREFLISQKYSNLIDLYSPRREKWDSSWKQSIEEKNFVEQVSWELENLENCDIVFMNLLSESKSPISLLEIGLFARSQKMIVCCPRDFYRRGNIEIVCCKYNIPLYEKFEEALGALSVKILECHSRRS